MDLPWNGIPLGGDSSPEHLQYEAPFDGSVPYEAPAARPEPVQCALKLLVTNSAAGSIIGKGGATINQLQEQSGARIKVANSSDYFPGTTERCVLITGAFEALLCAASLVVMKIQEAEQSREMDGEVVDLSPPFTVKMMVPNATVGAIIDKGGATINEMSALCGAQMKVSNKDAHATLGLTERMVSVTGNLEQMNNALNLIISKMQENPASAVYQNLSTSYGMRQRGPAGLSSAMAAMSLGGVAMDGMGTMGGGIPGMHHTTVTIGVLDSVAGFVVGKEGNTLRDIQRQSGTRIQMSRRGEYLPGTQSRSVTISGPAQAVQTAQLLISQKIQHAAIREVPGMLSVSAVEPPFGDDPPY